MRTTRRMLMANKGIDLNVEYVKTSGGQLIQTDWIPLVDAKIELYFHLKNYKETSGLRNSWFYTPNTTDNYVFSCNNGGNSGQWSSVFIWNALEYGYGGKIYSYNCSYYYKSETPLYFSIGKTKATMINEYGEEVDKTLDTRNGYNDKPIVLFGAANSPYNRAEMYIYGVKCWNDGVLERDFVPAKKKGVYGLYDKVQGKFWKSSTGVDFIGKDSNAIASLEAVAFRGGKS